MQPRVRCPVWRTRRQAALAALVQLSAALARMHPVTDLVLALTGPATKMMKVHSLSWTRSLRTRTRCKARTKLHQTKYRGDLETTDWVGEAPSITRAGSHLLPSEILSDRSLIHSCLRRDTQTVLAMRRPLVEGTDDPTPARTAPSVSPTPPISAGTFYATQGSGCIHVSSATRAS